MESYGLGHFGVGPVALALDPARASQRQRPVCHILSGRLRLVPGRLRGVA